MRPAPMRLIARDPQTRKLTAVCSFDGGKTWEIITREGRFPCPDPRPLTWPDRQYQNRPF